MVEHIGFVIEMCVNKQICEYFDLFGLIMPNEIKNYLHTSGKKMCTHRMKYKKEIVFYAVIGAYYLGVAQI